MKISRPKYYSLFSSIVLLVFLSGILQLITFFMLDLIPKGESISILPFFSLSLVMNKGISFGLGSELGISHLFAAASFIICAILFVWAIYLNHNFKRYSLILIVSGGLSNALDRCFHDGFVVDFLTAHIGSFYFPTFNLADVFIFIGAVTFIYLDLVKKKQQCRFC